MKKLIMAVAVAAIGLGMAGCVHYEHIERDRARHNHEVAHPRPPQPKSRPFKKRSEYNREMEAGRREAPRPAPRLQPMPPAQPPRR